MRSTGNERVAAQTQYENISKKGNKKLSDYVKKNGEFGLGGT